MTRNQNWDRAEENWKQLTGKVEERWGKLTDDGLSVINGKQDQLVAGSRSATGSERQVKELPDRMMD
jgi:uncharacterized protein YjbJ (UPF0337 family)